MRILITNDDGIHSEGIRVLAEMAAPYGEVWVVAPAAQCSASSQSITLRTELTALEVPFEVGCKRAFQIGGTPADCVRVALRFLMPERPDVVFSGINYGFNTGFDIAYSGTVAAAAEALLNGIPAIAYSNKQDGSFETVTHYFQEITDRILSEKQYPDRLWNVNFPGNTVQESRGVLWDRFPADVPVYDDTFIPGVVDEDGVHLTVHGEMVKPEDMPEGSDIKAVTDGYVSVGTYTCSLLSIRSKV